MKRVEFRKEKEKEKEKMRVSEAGAAYSAAKSDNGARGARRAASRDSSGTRLELPEVPEQRLAGRVEATSPNRRGHVRVHRSSTERHIDAH